VRIAEIARKHRIPDDDMVHAARMAVIEWNLDDELTMRVGPARNGTLLEIGILGVESDDSVIVHAMRCRSKFLPGKDSR
jgi:hypothetical protein